MLVDISTEPAVEAASLTSDAVDEQIRATREEASIEPDWLSVERRRLQAKAEGLSANVARLNDQIAIQTRIVASANAIFAQARPILDRGYITRLEYERRQQEVLRAGQQLEAFRAQLASAQASLAEARATSARLLLEGAQRRATLDARMASLLEKRASLEARRQYSLRSPISGYVTAVQAAPGRRVDPQRSLMTIMPAGSKLVGEIWIPSRAIGFVKRGQRVVLRYDAFPFERFGGFTGTIESVSRTVLFPDEIEGNIDQGAPVYRATVELDNQEIIAEETRVPLRPGMNLRASIVLDRQTFMDRFLNPLRAAAPK